VLQQQDDWRVCDEARSGHEAVQRFSQVKSDLVILDFQLPEMNGLDVARHMIEVSPATPILQNDYCPASNSPMIRLHFLTRML
jgi:YesN/AraC family two-component response regulator